MRYEHDPSSRGYEDFRHLSRVQRELERAGYFFHPVEKEHAEALTTTPLLQKIRSQIKRRGFEKVAGRVAITFSGYANDQREIWQVPEVRAYWRQLDRQLPELPALLTLLPPFGFNGPGQHLLLLGDVDAMIHQPVQGGYDVHVQGAEPILADATRRIHQTAVKYHLPHNTTVRLLEQFQTGASYRFSEAGEWRRPPTP